MVVVELHGIFGKTKNEFIGSKRKSKAKYAEERYFLLLFGSIKEEINKIKEEQEEEEKQISKMPKEPSQIYAYDVHGKPNKFIIRK